MVQAVTRAIGCTEKRNNISCGRQEISLISLFVVVDVPLLFITFRVEMEDQLCTRSSIFSCDLSPGDTTHILIYIDQKFHLVHGGTDISMFRRSLSLYPLDMLGQPVLFTDSFQPQCTRVGCVLCVPLPIRGGCRLQMLQYP